MMIHQLPEIQILHAVEGARHATGLAVIIDVFRAFTVTCYAFAKGAERIISVAKLEVALALRQQNPDFVLMGEREGERLPGFDYGNSPFEIEPVDLRGKTIVHTTTNGTQGASNAHAAAEIITGSFVNAGAIVAYIQAKKPEIVSLVPMGTTFGASAEEDTLCANYLKDLLQGKPTDFQAIKSYLRQGQSARIFFDPTLAWAPEEDFELCLSLNKFDFILQAQPYRDGLLSWQKVVLDDDKEMLGR